MTDLRPQAIEAMAGGSDVHPAIKHLCELYLDRLVGLLTEHADEWRTAAVPVLSASQPDIAGLLAVLGDSE